MFELFSILQLVEECNINVGGFTFELSLANHMKICFTWCTLFLGCVPILIWNLMVPKECIKRVAVQMCVNLFCQNSAEQYFSKPSAVLQYYFKNIRHKHKHILKYYVWFWVELLCCWTKEATWGLYDASDWKKERIICYTQTIHSMLNVLRYF